MEKVGILEGLLFVVGDEGLSLNQIKEILAVDDMELKEIIYNLKEKYNKIDSGLRLHILGNSFKLTTKNEHKDYFQKLIENDESNGLSQAALETLAIIAYNQPVTRLEVEEIRGVSSIQIIKKLVAKGLLKEAGRSENMGRAILYKTTSDFLDYFNLSSLDELPKIDLNINEKISDVDLYHSKYVEKSNDVDLDE